MMKKALVLNVMLLTPMYIISMEENKVVKACKQIAQELSSKELPLRFNPRFRDKFPEAVYQNPYIWAGITTTGLYVKNAMKHGNFGSLTGLVAKTFTLGLAAKWAAHELMVDRELPHYHYDEVFDYTGLFSKPACKSADRRDVVDSW